ncbi:MAG TPA: hypothetical protein VIO38_12865 [Rariglobus sp.]
MHQAQTAVPPKGERDTLAAVVATESLKDAGSALIAYCGARPPLRSAFERARVVVSDVSLPVPYYVLVATVLDKGTPIEVCRAMLHAILYAYMAWSTSDLATLEHRVPDPLLRAAVYARASQPRDPTVAYSPVLATAHVCHEDATLHDLTMWAIMPAVCLSGNRPRTLFGGRLAGAVRPALAHSPTLFRFSDLGTLVAVEPGLADLGRRSVALVHSVDVPTLAHIAGWPSGRAPTAPTAALSMLCSGMYDGDFWRRLRDSIDHAVVAHMPVSEGPAGGCAALARDGLLPRMSELFPMDLCIALCDGVACVFYVSPSADARSNAQATWQAAFDRVAVKGLLPPRRASGSNAGDAGAAIKAERV